MAVKFHHALIHYIVQNCLTVGGRPKSILKNMLNLLKHIFCVSVSPDDLRLLFLIFQEDIFYHESIDDRNMALYIANLELIAKIKS